MRAHRLAWLISYGCWPKGLIDHINGDTDDNRLANLRLATHTTNNHNRHHVRADSQTGTLGVGYKKDRRRFYAHIKVAGRRRFLGYFDSRTDAEAAYFVAKRKLHPAFVGVGTDG